MTEEVESCAPINSLRELWEIYEHPPKWAKFTSPISKRANLIKNKDVCTKEHACHYLKGRKTVPQRYRYGTLPKTLVCHDMKNGYQEDKYVNGGRDHSAYLFYHWAAIDMFVYFSHHFITIPPLGWINVAHKHGVKILGTIITEWKEGSKICEEIFASEEAMMKFVTCIAWLSDYFNLDGWLLNIENNVNDTDMLLKFIKSLTHAMHTNNPNSEVIWYDSVVDTGELDWQNCLNVKNKIYFDACDGIFTNYCWSRSHLENSARLAGVRKYDVYVGVDVWGRNFWGGGGFNTADAVKEIFNHNLSMAIFAPAWTHEAINMSDIYPIKEDQCIAKGKDNPDLSIAKCKVKDLFLLRESALWHTLWPYLNSSGPIQLPFHSFFCLGSGEVQKYNGELINKNVWYHLLDQQYQPSYPVCYDNFALEFVPVPLTKKKNCESHAAPTPNDTDSNEIEPTIEVASADVCEASTRRAPKKTFKIRHNEEKVGCSSYYLDDCYYGGSCLKISPLKFHENEIKYKIIRRLFLCEFQCDANFIIYYIVKPLSDDCQIDQDLNLCLTLQHNKSKEVRNYTLGEKQDVDELNQNNKHLIFPINGTEEFAHLVKNLKSAHPGFYLNTDNNKGWKIRYYSVNFPNSTLLQIDCELVNDKCPMLLGGVGVAKDILSF